MRFLPHPSCNHVAGTQPSAGVVRCGVPQPVTENSPRQIMQQAMLRDVYDIDIRIEDIDGNRIGVYFA